MIERRNEFGQAIGPDVPGWTPRELPPRSVMQGRTCRLEPYEPRHAAGLFAAYREDADGRNWTYLGYGPVETEAEFLKFAEATYRSEDPLFHVVVDAASGRELGIASYLRIDAANGVIEVGHINFSPLMQGSVQSTEAMYLMMRRVFDELGYRRYEWKCDALNGPSRRAAGRLGFSYEGTFRQAMVYKGRNRDTAWFSILDSEWPHLRTAFEAWLSPENFDLQGRQIQRLEEIRSQAR
ncbi:GNAT family protein [Stappia sp. WLB 29]|uniref:GNAT family N-acetyltransferase n=1 Tax=Stappia sp. WLB 29 TaxID=2925220 RepID=UPI0020BF0CA7|nr:GNAT family protein [Stappia sp. WLB 29]